ncbi:hypothetical protein Taro_033498 [Colocasia esculenta]|uniref:Uncharacterized protein n=1 Tax=Colocasia esculenta TaxID=4460 RepID=A0A843VVF7_COLES|nr:hypothetical protein [Colocasia esculenta]
MLGLKNEIKSLYDLLAKPRKVVYEVDSAMIEEYEEQMKRVSYEADESMEDDYYRHVEFEISATNEDPLIEEIDSSALEEYSPGLNDWEIPPGVQSGESPGRGDWENALCDRRTLSGLSVLTGRVFFRAKRESLLPVAEWESALLVAQIKRVFPRHIDRETELTGRLGCLCLQEGWLQHQPGDFASGTTGRPLLSSYCLYKRSSGARKDFGCLGNLPALEFPALERAAAQWSSLQKKIVLELCCGFEVGNWMQVKILGQFSTTHSTLV